jgi:DNA-binding transcriptional MocR family regulator
VNRQCEPFVKVPVALLRDGRTPVAERLLLAVLMSYDWHGTGCWPSQVQLSEDMGCSERTVRTLVRRLEARGWVGTRRGGRRMSNRYVLNAFGLRSDRKPPSAHQNSDRQSVSGVTGNSQQVTGSPLPVFRKPASAEVEDAVRSIYKEVEGVSRTSLNCQGPVNVGAVLRDMLNGHQRRESGG